ncbi:hypothetical protein EEL30_21820 [Brevibacillus laterosporus]|uniref:Uncharacterized protein n=1 Tax=Brevibacillus laterosporus TaxID=1465 RepID=A0A518VCG9_BRELA|nr:hypothetical protein EEL30_21820 [Brevibacillus laterosporus]
MKYLERIVKILDDPSYSETVNKIINNIISESEEDHRIADGIKLYYPETNKRVRIGDRVISNEEEEYWGEQVTRINEDGTINVTSPLDILKGISHKNYRLHTNKNVFFEECANATRKCKTRT